MSLKSLNFCQCDAYRNIVYENATAEFYLHWLPWGKISGALNFAKPFLSDLDDLKSGLTELLERKGTLVEGGGIVCVIISMSYIK